MQKLKFYKMHGLGNDYIYMFESECSGVADFATLSRAVSDRHFGIGADGLVIIGKSETADFKMRIWNADGSEAQMCGNASRCVARLLHDTGRTKASTITLETLAGIRVLMLNIKHGEVDTISVDMGAPILDPDKIPVCSTYSTMKTLTHVKVEVAGNDYTLYCVSMGNPHGVCFVDKITDYEVLFIGPELEKSAVWPQKANIEFVRVMDRHNIEMRVWERGSGETLACGTGSCAVAVASILRGEVVSPVTIHLRGGNLKIEWDGNPKHSVKMTGTATIICKGEYFYE